MTEQNETIEGLQFRLDKLVRTQIDFQQEITSIRNELKALGGNGKPTSEPVKLPVIAYVSPEIKPIPAAAPKAEQTYRETEPPSFGYTAKSRTSDYAANPPFVENAKSDLEKFIGENLISKIGILILVIGVAIGGKYAIDENLISPLMRIIIGYIFGFGLVGLAIKLKPNYHNFSAVLISGGMAIMYFITYFAYSLYSLFDQSAAFALMLLFTIFTISAALIYSRQVIAHIGLVGAYAVPFLLSNDSGNYTFLFSYVAIVNLGILVVSAKKYWKSLFYTTFLFTWATYFGWSATKYNADEHFILAFSFLTIFFLIFYATFIVYKLISEENIALENISLVLLNSSIFFGTGYVLLDGHGGFDDYLGLFTVANAGIHFAVAVIAGRLKRIPMDLLYLLGALVLTFMTISIPVQFDGNWVTLLWTVEAGILFTIGRTKQIPLYEYYSFPLMILAGLSLITDWAISVDSRTTMAIAENGYPVFNPIFLTALIFVIVFGLILRVNSDKRFEPVIDESTRRIIAYAVAGAALAALYNTFRMEIDNYFHYRSVAAGIESNGVLVVNNSGHFAFNVLWQLNYTMLFLTVLGLVNMAKVRNHILAFFNLTLNFLVIAAFLSVGLYFLGELRASYMLAQLNAGLFFIWIRYISIVFAAGVFAVTYRYINQYFVLEHLDGEEAKLGFEFGAYISGLILASSELIHWFDIFGYNDSHKLGLSILWGTYALFMVIAGIYQSKKHLRIGAMVLFAITLGKLFFYDIADLSTISRTVVFVCLGILLLIISFLYNKYKAFIFEPDEA